MGYGPGVPTADPSRRRLTKRNLFGGHTMLTRRHLLATAAAWTAAISGAGAQNYARQPIHILVGYAAGGGVDIVARLLQEAMKSSLGPPIVIGNRTVSG